MRPNFAVPAGTCNCHTHVVGSIEAFPQAAGRPFSYGPATVDELVAMLDASAISRVVLVQPAVYGHDHHCLLAALSRLGARAKGVAVIDPECSDAELEILARAGVVGSRIVLSGPQAIDRIERVAARIRGRGWHLQFAGTPAIFSSLRRRLEVLAMPIMLDHFAGAVGAAGVGQAGFADVLDMVRTGSVNVKLSSLHPASALAPGYPDMAPLVQALVAAGADRLVWGNNWPHPHISLAEIAGKSAADIVPWSDIDDGDELNLMAGWIGNHRLIEKILVENPARFYGF